MNAPAQTLTFSCASCESSFDWSPIFYRGDAYCCAGCAAGGPCCCSYDRTHGSPARCEDPLPMTRQERDRLAAEAARLRLELAAAIERRHVDFGMPRNEGSELLPVWQIEARQRDLAIMEDALARASVETPSRHPIIGAVITLQAPGGECEILRLVAPGKDDHTLNRVSFDSPFGQLLGRLELGSSLALKVVDGARSMTVVDIAYPAEVASAARRELAASA